MKKPVLAVALVFSCFAHADPACNALSAYIGQYKLISKSGDGCANGPFNEKLTVEAYSRGDISGFMIETGEIGIGPCVQAACTDKCSSSGRSVSVETCGLDHGGCLPKYWTYNFSDAGVQFSANGCTVQFSKVN